MLARHGVRDHQPVVRQNSRTVCDEQHGLVLGNVRHAHGPDPPPAVVQEIQESAGALQVLRVQPELVDLVRDARSLASGNALAKALVELEQARAGGIEEVGRHSPSRALQDRGELGE